MNHTRTAIFQFQRNDQWETVIHKAFAEWKAEIPDLCPIHGEPTERKFSWAPHIPGPPGFDSVEFICKYAPCRACAVGRAGFQLLHHQSSFENFEATTDELQANLAKAREFAADPTGFLLLLGRCGTGKTLLAAAIVRAVGRGRYFRHLGPGQPSPRVLRPPRTRKRLRGNAGGHRRSLPPRVAAGR